MSPNQGRLVSIEGVDGAGKSTQVAALGQQLRESGVDIEIVRPEDTDLGAHLRGYLLGLSHEAPVPPWVEALLFTAGRAQLVTDVILPALNRGAVVIADRYVDSTLAYQGGAGGISPELLRRLHREACQDLWPDLTVLLMLDPSAAAARQQRRAMPLDRFERAPLDYHAAVAGAFASLAAADPERFVRIDASRAPEFVSTDVRQAVDALLRSRPVKA